MARAAAAAARQHMADLLAEARASGRTDLAPEPDEPAIEAMIDAAFWASLRREEGYSPTISLAFLPPGRPAVRLTLEKSLPLAPEPLTRLAPAVERPGIHLGVWRENGELRVWGSTQSLPALCLVVEVIAPGLLVMKHSRGEESGKFANVAVLEGDHLKVLNQQAAAQPGSPLLLKALRSLDSGRATGSGAVLIQMATSMRAHSHGGALLLVPSGTDVWRESIVKPIRYAVAPGFTKLAELMREPSAGRHEHRWQEAVRSAVDGIAGLTAVDGAAVITDEYELVAFGATISRRNGGHEVEHVALVEPVQGSTPVIVPASQFGGTRHLSAAQFVHDQHESVALVASKDGRFTVLAWSEPEQIVQAHRIEALLL
ncbi:MAG TPA: hypothetical protein VN428_14975 [Bryobacteraceae bacterium]|nr:hypothetical protein [Bryobacteraceae bacterium]